MNVVNHHAVIKSICAPVKLSYAITMLGLFASVSANAQSSYQYENSIIYSQLQRDTLPAEDFDGWALAVGGVSYFQRVNTNRGPLAEAAFLGKASGVRLFYTRTDTEESLRDENWIEREENKTDDVLLNVEYYIPDSIFYASLGVAAQKQSSADKIILEGRTYTVDRDKGEWDYIGIASAGITPVTGWLIWSSFHEGQDVGDEWNIHSKYVWLLQGEQALNIELGYEEFDTGVSRSNYSLSADYYVNKTLSLGVAHSEVDYDDAGTIKTNQVRIKNFFSESISVQAAYIDMDKERSVLVGGSYRF